MARDPGGPNPEDVALVGEEDPEGWTHVDVGYELRHADEAELRTVLFQTMPCYEGRHFECLDTVVCECYHHIADRITGGLPAS